MKREHPVRYPSALGRASAAALFAACLVSRIAGAVVHEGVNGWTNSWQFERFDCGCPPCDVSCPLLQLFQFDVGFAWRDYDFRRILLTPHGGRDLDVSSIYGALVLPSDGYAAVIDHHDSDQIVVGDCYAIRTRAGAYAVIQLTAVGERISFVYRYQDDGTRVFPVSTSVEAATWGRIKSLLASPRP